MAQRKPYNPNTKYGRRKLNQAHHQRVQNMTHEERDDLNKRTAGCFIVALIVGGLIVFLIFGFDGLISWLGGKRPY